MSLAPELDKERLTRISAELVRAVRGKRSQRLLSERLGFGSNVLYRWESGQRSPTLLEFFALAKKTGIDVRAALVRFDARLETVPARASDEVLQRALLAGLWHQSHAELSRRTQIGPTSLSRYLKGRAELRLPLFFTLLEAATSRLLDWIAAFVDPARVPSVSEAHRRLELARRAASEGPYAEAILALLETRAYRTEPAHREGWIAERLGIARSVEASTLALLVELGWVQWIDDRFAVTEARQVDTRALPASAYTALKQFWARDLARRFESTGVDGSASAGPPQMAYVTFSTSQARLERIATLVQETYYRIREVLQEPESPDEVERAGLVTLGLAAFDAQPLPTPKKPSDKPAKG